MENAPEVIIDRIPAVMSREVWIQIRPEYRTYTPDGRPALLSNLAGIPVIRPVSVIPH